MAATYSWLSPSLMRMIRLMWSAVSVAQRKSSGRTVQ